MWRLIFVLTVLFVLAPSIRAQGNKRAEDEKAVREVVNKIANTAKDESARTRATLFADDAQIINAFGNKAEGRKEIDEFWREECSIQGRLARRKIKKKISKSASSHQN